MDVDFARPFFGDEERAAVNRVMAGHWLASGKENERFEAEFAEKIGARHALAVNSGSSANLIALASLDLPRGSKVMTSGCGFPATLSPVLHLGLEPVLVDYEVSTCNPDLNQVWERRHEVKAAIFAHTMGNPCPFAYQLDGPVIEDCCEALGASYRGDQAGSGNIGTFSFYPSHQITALGSGGMVTFNDTDRYLRAKSLRDWGKSATGYGRNNTAYSAEVDGMPYFPHYVYDSVGWNFKMAEANAAFGRVQLRKLDWIVAERKRNHDQIAASLPEGIATPKALTGAVPSWFGVILITPYPARLLGEALESLGVRHRPFFAGNITRHPAFRGLKARLPVADFLMERAIFVGCYAGMTQAEVAYVSDAIRQAHALCCP